MRTLWLCLLILLVPAAAAAQGYIERKDNDALAVIERSMAKVAEDPRLFDGKAVVAGSDLAALRALADAFHLQLRGAESGLRELSPAGRQRGAALLVRYDRWSAYGRALIDAQRKAQAAADEAARRDAAVAERDKALGLATCKAFRDEVLADSRNLQRLELIARVASGSGEHWQTVEDGAEYLATMKATAAACARPERADLARACAHATYGQRVAEAEWCAAVRNPDTVMKQSARSLAAWHAEHLLVGRSADELEQHEGWIDVEGGVTWASYFSGAHAKELMSKRLGPVFAQAGLDIADAAVFGKLEAHYQALEVKVRALAPTWDVPGTTCKGVACAAAKHGVARWNGGARIRRITQNAAGWTVVQNALGIPTHRWKSGYALIEVKGDPMCQLRSWNVSEDHKGGGRYQAASSATLGYVRWQTCR
jgi:hypothetical protein